MSWLTLLITVPLTLLAVLFGISNIDGDVTLALWPFDSKYTMPLYQFGLGTLAGGFFCGALFVWLLSQKTRFHLWQESRKSARLEKELEALTAKTAAAAKDVPSTPALPAK